MTSAQTPISWNVVSQIPDFDIGPGGTPVKGWKVSFDLSNGDRGEVFVPASIYDNKDQVYQIIAAKAASIATTAQMSGVVGEGT